MHSITKLTLNLYFITLISAHQPELAATAQENTFCSNTMYNALQVTSKQVDNELLLEVGSALAIHTLTKPNNNLRYTCMSILIQSLVERSSIQKSLYSKKIQLSSLSMGLIPLELNIEVGTKECASTLYTLTQQKEVITATDVLVRFLAHCNKSTLDYNSKITTSFMPIYKSQVVIMANMLANVYFGFTTVGKDFVCNTGSLFNYSIISSLLHAVAQRTGIPQNKLNILFDQACHPKTTMQRVTKGVIDHCFNQAVNRFCKAPEVLPVSNPNNSLL